MTASIPHRIEIDDEKDHNWHSFFCSLDSSNSGLVSVNDLRRSLQPSYEETDEIAGGGVQPGENERAVGPTSMPIRMKLIKRQITPEKRFGPKLRLSDDESDALLKEMQESNDDFWDFPQFCSSMAKVKKMHMTQSLFYAARSVLSRRAQSDAFRYLLEYNCFPPPLFMILITLAQIGFYLYFSFSLDGKLSADRPVPFHSIFILNPYKKEQIWRFLTYMFIHVGYMHLIGNILVQLILGLPLELVHKLWRVSLLYCLGVVTGAVLMMVFDSNTYLGGASAGVYALISAHVSNLVLNWDEIELNFIQAGCLGIFICSDVGIAFYQQYMSDEPNTISYVSHIGGFIAGLLLGIVLLRNLKWKEWEIIAWRVCLGLYLAFMAICITLIVVLPVFS